ncbi:pleurocidin-like peptide WF3 [Stigmatopora argus]
MKWTAAFLVVVLVVLLAQPGECFLGMLMHGITHGIGMIHRMIHPDSVYGEEVEVDKRSLEFADN